MKLSRSLLVLPCLFLASCTSVEIAPVEAPGIVVAQEETRETGQAKILFPAGVYKAEVVSAEGTFYKSPRRLKTLGVLLGRSEDGGIFISSSQAKTQAGWFGDPREEVDGSPGTLFGAMGVSKPKLWRLTPPIPYVMESAPKQR